MYAARVQNIHRLLRKQETYLFLFPLFSFRPKFAKVPELLGAQAVISEQQPPSMLPLVSPAELNFELQYSTTKGVSEVGLLVCMCLPSQPFTV